MEDTVNETPVDTPVVEAVSEPTEEKVLATEKVAQENPEVVQSASVQEAPKAEDTEKNVISGPKKQKAPRASNTTTKQDNTIASNAADYALFGAPKPSAKVKKEKDDTKVALWSDKNLRWSDVGEVVKGYNIVTEEAAAQWLTKSGIRKATPEEVAAHYSK